MKDILAGFLIGIVIVIFLYPYFSNIGIPEAIDRLSKEVRELKKMIEERIEKCHY